MFEQIRKFSLLIAPFLIFLSALTSQAGGLSPELQSLLPSLTSQDEISVIVILSDRPNAHLIKDQDRRLLRSRIIRHLREKAVLTQGPVRAFLEIRRAKKIKSLWLINGLAVTATANVIQEMASLPEVGEVRLDRTIQTPVVTYGASTVPEWNITAIKAPDLWNIGFTGKGVVVASMDTGVDYLHPDLASKWRGGTNSWYDPNGQHATPYDASGHGTGTMGIMVGGSEGGTAIGVAPGTKWIAVKIFNDAGNSSLSIIHQGFQWLLDPDDNPDTDDAPDVVNNSWWLSGTVNQCVLEFDPDIQTLNTAGIVVVFSAGNSGPGSQTSVAPANNPNAFPVGAIDILNNIASFSSRGPSACGGGIYPTAVAPGVNVKTSDLTLGGVFPNSYAIVSGTSFSAPHVAGTMALLKGAFPDLTVSELESVLKQSALNLGTSGPDNDYGYGLVEGYNAYIQAFQILYGQSVSDFITHYYDSLLDRPSDPEGKNFWTIEIQRIVSLGIDVREGLITLAKLFFNSSEYLQKNKPDNEYVIDLYQAFLNRMPSQIEVDFWVGYLTGGATRNIVLNYFAFSSEFDVSLEGIFGVSATRAESNLVTGFYRGLLTRTPDTDGFVYWINLMRDAQCTEAQQVRDLSYQIAALFVGSAEYEAKGRTNLGYVEDLYDAIMRRSAAPSEVNFWVGVLDGATMTRDQVLQFFANSPEFQIRVQEVIDAGCLP
jgi:bacillopeptidase F